MALFGSSGKSGSQRLAEQQEEARKGHATSNTLFKSIGTPVQRAAAPSTMSGGPPVIFKTAGQIRREREAEAEVARKAAEDRGGHVIVRKGAVTMTMRKLDPALSKNALAALDYILVAWQAAGRKAVQVLASDVARHAHIRVEAARAALDELRGTGHLVDVRDGSMGTGRIMPSSKVTGQLD